MTSKLAVSVLGLLIVSTGCADLTVQPAPQDTTVPPSSIAASATTTTASSTTAVSIPTEIGAYFVGNSLTHQTLGAESGGYRSWYVLASQVDAIVSPLGWHIKCGSSLASIAANPGEVCIDPAETGDTYDSALTRGRDWNFVSFQPYPGAESTLASDVEFIATNVADLPSDTTVVLFTGWPALDAFSTTWSSGLEVSDVTPTVISKAYVEALMARLTVELRQDVVLVPTAEVLSEVALLLDAGSVPGIEGLDDLYSDNVHLNDRGDWLSGVVMASVILDVDPTRFGKPRGPWYGDSAQFPKEFIRVVREVTERVLSGRD